MDSYSVFYDVWCVVGGWSGVRHAISRLLKWRGPELVQVEFECYESSGMIR